MNLEILKGKTGIIFGALDENSIAWKVAEECSKAGAKFTLTNAPVAIRMGKIKALAEKCQSPLIAADATNTEDLENLFKETVDCFDGRIDFLLHSIGMSPNVRKKRAYTDLNYNFLQKTLDISAISNFRINYKKFWLLLRH